MPGSSRKPRLAYLFSRYPVVSQTFCDSEMLALEQMGYEILIGALNPPPNSFRHERLDRLKAEIHYPPPPDVLAAFCQHPDFEGKLGPLIADHTARYGTSYKPLVRARNAFYMAHRFGQLGVDHVHVHFANRATHSALFLKELGLPFSFTAHAQDFMFDLGSHSLLAEMVQAAEFVVAVSDYSRHLLIQMTNCDPSKVVRIFNGIDLSEFERSPIKQRSPLRVVSVGRLIEFKGFQHLIGACAILKQQGVSVELHIIGDGPLRSQFESRITRDGLQDQVKLLGVRSQDQIRQELFEADVFALASIIDSGGASDILPTVITEAMASHLPVVSTTVTGIPEMVENEVSGLLVKPTDEAALAAAIARLGGDPELRQQMGRAGRERAEQWFTFDSTAGVLGQRFVKAHAGRPHQDRPPSDIVYLTHEWRGEPLTPLKEVRWLAGLTIWPKSGGDVDSLRRVEILPDASVLESIWLRRAGARHQLESVRALLGDHVTGTQFYLHARHAVYLADTLPKRATRHLHARGSTALITVWLLHQLLPDLSISCAIEDSPALPRSLLIRLLDVCQLMSISDAVLLDQLGRSSTVADDLQLRPQFERKETRIGPVRIKRKVATTAPDRNVLEAAFLQRIHHSLSRPS